MKKIKIKQKDIWDATRPNVYANKKKYKRKKKIAGYYMDYDGKERIIYEDER